VRFDQYGGVISVNGKTGRRDIRLRDSVPALQEYINHHPMKNNPGAPLFVTSRRRGALTVTRLTPRRVQNIFARLGDLSECSKAANPHSYRHGRLTVGGKQLTESELRMYAGWSRGSSMPAVYVHLSSRDIENKIMQVDGVILEEEPAPDPMAPIFCPRCKKQNPPDTRYCGACSFALSDEAADSAKRIEKLEEDDDLLIELLEKRKARQAAAAGKA
jgi:hypothetical protein